MHTNTRFHTHIGKPTLNGETHLRSLQLAAWNRLHSIRLLPSIIYTYNYSFSSFAQRLLLSSLSLPPPTPLFSPTTFHSLAAMILNRVRVECNCLLLPGERSEAKQMRSWPGQLCVCLAVSQIVAAEREGAKWERQRESARGQATCSLQLHNKSNLINWGQSARTSIGAGRTWAQVAY